jgi:hypothetical protein
VQHTNTSSMSSGSTTSLFYRDLGARWQHDDFGQFRGVSPNAIQKPRTKKNFSQFRSGAREGSRDGLPRECIGRRVRVRMP